MLNSLIKEKASLFQLFLTALHASPFHHLIRDENSAGDRVLY